MTAARSEYILDVRNPVRDTRAFAQIQARLGRMAPAPTTEAATTNTRVMMERLLEAGVDVRGRTCNGPPTRYSITFAGSQQQRAVRCRTAVCTRG